MKINRTVNDKLRERLSELIDPARLEKQPRLVESLRREIPHSIRLIRSINIRSPQSTWHFNCHAYSFFLLEWDDFFDQVSDRAVSPDGRFVNAMLPLMREKTQREAKGGDLVVFFAPDEQRSSLRPPVK